MKEESINHNKLPALAVIITAMFFIIERVLLTATTAPSYAEAPRRYFLFAGMKVLVAVAVNLLPLWLGYHWHLFKNRNPLARMAKYWLFYFLSMLFTFVFFFFLRGTLTFRDLWIIFFPISQNYFGFGVSFILITLLSPYLFHQLEKLELVRVKQILIVTTILAVLLPTIFSKDLWGFLTGKGVLWQLYLVVVGFGLNRLKLLQKIRFLVPKLIGSMLVVVSLIFIMAQVSRSIRGDVSTAERFSVPYSLFAMVYSLYLFAFIERIQEKINLKMSSSFLATYLISLVVITNNGLVTWSVSEYYRLPLDTSLKKWLLGIITAFGIFFIVITLWSIVLNAVSHINLFKRLENRLKVESYQGLFERGQQFLTWLKSKKRVIWLGIFYYVLVVIQMGIMVLVTSGYPKEVFLENLLTRQPALLLNVAIMMAFMLLLFLITNRFWYAATFATMFYVVLTISSYLKILLRQEPILPGDLTMLTSINEIVTLVQPTLLIVGAIIMVILAVSAWLLQRRAQKMYAQKISYKKRLLGIGVILFLFSGVFFINHQNSPANLLFRLLRIDNQFFNQPKGAQKNGPLVQFLVNIDVDVMDEPAGYTKEKITEIMTKYDNVASEINMQRAAWPENQTIIFNLSESFSDPTRIPETKITGDPIPNLRQIKTETTSGLMVSTGYGGGTANIEWETLSGLSLSNLAPTLPTPYTQLVDKQDVAPNFSNLFDHKIMIHPYVATLYNRIHVFEKYGFDAFYYQGSEDELSHTDRISGSPYISDKAAYAETLDQLQKASTGTQFIQLSTMQNHGPYDYTYPDNEFDFIGPSVEKTNSQAFRTYMQGLKYTDDALVTFLKELDKIQKPITFVFYGDHLPSLYSGLDMAEYGIELHETDFFVYNNAYTRNQQKLTTDIVSPNYFSALSLQQANLKVTPYYALLTQLAEKVSAMTTNPASSSQNQFNGTQIFVTDDGKVLDEGDLTKEQKAIFDDYRLIQYDLTVGEQYSAKWATQKVTK